MSKCPAAIIAVLLGIVLLIAGCASSANGRPVSVEGQVANGEPIYTQTCATSTCHGIQGEGIRSSNGFKIWPLIGKDFQTRHPNAQIVFDVIRSGGERNLLALTDQQIYDAIAYELNQNQIALKVPLTADNAYGTFGGKMSGNAQGGLFPPSDNTTLIDPPLTLDLPIVAQNDRLRLQLDQFAQASSIGNNQGTYLILVVAFSDLDNDPITVNPEHMTLSTPSGKLLKPQSSDIHSAIEKFHTQTIKPQHGTVGLVVFALSTPDDFDKLIYDDGIGDRLTLALKP
jgi:hypothetical protein